MERAQIKFSPPDITELEIKEVCEALQSGWITTGPKTKELERALSSFVGGGKVVCLNSATAALELALVALGIGEGDEVIVPAYTYTASASVVHHVGAKIVFVDVAKDSFELDYEALPALINEKTKAIIAVDIGGRLCDYERLIEIAEERAHLFQARTDLQRLFARLIIIADSAHALGAKRLNREKEWEYAGARADFSEFSFHAVKNLTTAEGGALTWRPRPGLDDEEFYKQIQLLSLHGQNKDALAKTKLGAWEYDIIYPAYKCNMTDILAAIGLAQLKRYPDMLLRRKEIVAIYDQISKDFSCQALVHADEHSDSSCHLYLLRVAGISEEQRNEIIEEMARLGIACNVHYKPLPMMTAYKNLGFDIKDFPNSYAQYANVISLPLHSRLSLDDAKYVLEQLSVLLTKLNKNRVSL